MYNFTRVSVRVDFSCVFGVVHAMWWFHDGSEKKTVSVHHIFCKSQEKCDGDIINDCGRVWEKSMSHTWVSEWHDRFVKAGLALLTTTNTLGGPSDSQCLALLPQNSTGCSWGSHQTSYIADEVVIGYETYQWILTAELGMHHIAIKLCCKSWQMI